MPRIMQRMMVAPVAKDVCKLTLQAGKFVRSHLIPIAFTAPEVSGAPLTQFHSGKPPSRRWTSWYDDRLVSRTSHLPKLRIATPVTLRTANGARPPTFVAVPHLNEVLQELTA